MVDWAAAGPVPPWAGAAGRQLEQACPVIALRRRADFAPAWAGLVVATGLAPEPAGRRTRPAEAVLAEERCWARHPIAVDTGIGDYRPYDWLFSTWYSKINHVNTQVTRRFWAAGARSIGGTQSRSLKSGRSGGIGRRARLKIVWDFPVGVRVSPPAPFDKLMVNHIRLVLPS